MRLHRTNLPTSQPAATAPESIREQTFVFLRTVVVQANLNERVTALGNQFWKHGRKRKKRDTADNFPFSAHSELGDSSANTSESFLSATATSTTIPFGEKHLAVSTQTFWRGRGKVRQKTSKLYNCSIVFFQW